jgi:hypothetical protein
MAWIDKFVVLSARKAAVLLFEAVERRSMVEHTVVCVGAGAAHHVGRRFESALGQIVFTFSHRSNAVIVG